MPIRRQMILIGAGALGVAAAIAIACMLRAVSARAIATTAMLLGGALVWHATRPARAGKPPDMVVLEEMRFVVQAVAGSTLAYALIGRGAVLPLPMLATCIFIGHVFASASRRIARSTRMRHHRSRSRDADEPPSVPRALDGPNANPGGRDDRDQPND